MDERKGRFGDSQNELRCKNNGIGEETARRARKLGVFGIYKTNYVVKTTEFAERPRGGRGNGVFSGIAKRITLLKQRNWGETVRQVRKRGVLGIHKTNYVVKTTEFGERSRGGRGQQMESCAGGGMPRKKCAKNAPRADAAFLFLGCVCKMGQAAACWRAKSADGGGNRGMAVEIGGHLRKRTRATGVRYFPEACRWGMREKVHALPYNGAGGDEFPRCSAGA